MWLNTTISVYCKTHFPTEKISWYLINISFVKYLSFGFLLKEIRKWYTNPICSKLIGINRLPFIIFSKKFKHFIKFPNIIWRQMLKRLSNPVCQNFNSGSFKIHFECTYRKLSSRLQWYFAVQQMRIGRASKTLCHPLQQNCASTDTQFLPADSHLPWEIEGTHAAITFYEQSIEKSTQSKSHEWARSRV